MDDILIAADVLGVNCNPRILYAMIGLVESGCSSLAVMAVKKNTRKLAAYDKTIKKKS